MSGNVKLVYTVSKEAAKLVKQGLAVYESGGVRDLSGKLIELARPTVGNAIGSTLSSLSSPITAISSLANNVQSAVIQKGVNEANLKLDYSLEKLDQIQKSMSKLGTTNALAWANSVIGVANCAITIAEFQKVFEKLDNISSQINGIAEFLQAEKENNLRDNFHTNCLNLRDDCMELAKTAYIPDKTNIARDINKTNSLLKSVIKDFESRRIDGKLGAQIIFNLAPIYAAVIRMYSDQYLQEMGTLPPNYNDWISVFEEINSDTFKEILKNILTVEFLGVSPEVKYNTYAGVMIPAEEQLGTLLVYRDSVKCIEASEHKTLDDIFGNRILQNQYVELDDRVCLTVN